MGGRGSTYSSGSPAGVTEAQRNRIRILQTSASLQGSVTNLKFRKEKNGTVKLSYKNTRTGGTRIGSISKNGQVTYQR